MRSSAGGSAAGSNRRRGVRPIMRHPPGRRHGIDAGLRSADGHTAGRYAPARRLQTRHGDGFRQSAQIRKSGREAQEIYQVFGARMNRDDVIGRVPGQRRDRVQIRPVFAAVRYRNLQMARLGRWARPPPARRVPQRRVLHPGGGSSAGRNRSGSKRRRDGRWLRRARIAAEASGAARRDAPRARSGRRTPQATNGRSRRLFACRDAHTGGLTHSP